MKKEEKEIKQLLIRVGIGPDLKGYHYLAEAIALQRAQFDRGETTIPFMRIYNTIAEKHGDSASRVERNMRFAIERAFDGDNALQEGLFENLINRNSGKVSNSCFVATLAEYFAFEGGKT